MKAPKGFEFITKPYEFQYEAFVYGIEHPRAGILYDLGLGKTKIAIDIMRYWIQQGKCHRVLVCGPTSILRNWQREVEKHSEYRALVLTGTRNERLQLLRVRDERYKFFIINYEALRLFEKELLALKCNGIIMDESARYIKNPEAKRTQACSHLANMCDFRYILTATPIANRPLDIWSQFYMLDEGETFGNVFWAYRSMYFDKVPMKIKGNRFNKWVFKEGYAQTIHDKLFSKCIRKTKEEAMGQDLPEQTFTEILIPMPGDLLATYQTVEEQVLASIITRDGSALLEINSILTKLLRLQQITSGFTKDDISGQEHVLSSQPKLEALMEQIDSIVDAEESVVVWCRFIRSIDMIKQRIEREFKRKIKCLTMSGQDKDKFAKWKTFQERNDIPVFIAQVESGGIGIELFKLDNTADKSQHMIFYENTWSLDVRQQAIGRIHRIGQKAHCNYIDLVVEDSIDQRILRSLKANKMIADAILNEGIESWLSED